MPPQVMTTKDYFEIAYWIVSVLILSATVFYIYYAPIKAVKVGRQLNDEQNKDTSKRQLFLTLFAYRGSPVHYEFVNSLNKIDIVFQDEKPVLDAWHKYYDALHQEETPLIHQTWELLRVEMLSQMAISLGYKELKQVDIMKNYYPIGHKNVEQEDFDFRQSAKRYFDIGHHLYSILIQKQNES